MTQAETFREGLDKRGVKYQRANDKHINGCESVDVTSFSIGDRRYDFAEVVDNGNVHTFVTIIFDSDAEQALELIDKA